MSTQSQSGSRSWLIVVAAVLIAGLALFVGSLLARMNDDAGHASDDVSEPGNPDYNYHIVTTINPLAMIAREVGGLYVRDASSIVPPGATPHGFEPTVSNVATAQQADLVLAVGGEFDAWILTSANANATLIEMLDVAEHEHEDEAHSESKEEHADEDHAHEDEHEGEDDHEHEDDHDEDHAHEDPHVWLDPHTAGHYALEIADVLASDMPEYASQFRANAQEFVAELEVVESELTEQIEMVNTQQGSAVTVITMHDAYEPLAEAFGFRIAGSYEPEPGTSPSPSDLAELKELVEERDVTFFATEPQLEGIDASVPQQIACDLGVYLTTLDPIGIEGQSYVELLRANIEAVTVQPIDPPSFDCVGL